MVNITPFHLWSMVFQYYAERHIAAYRCSRQTRKLDQCLIYAALFWIIFNGGKCNIEKMHMTSRLQNGHEFEVLGLCWEFIFFHFWMNRPILIIYIFVNELNIQNRRYFYKIFNQVVIKRVDVYRNIQIYTRILYKIYSIARFFIIKRNSNKNFAEQAHRKTISQLKRRKWLFSCQLV